METARKGVTTAEAEAGSLRVAKAERVAKLGTLQEQLEGISHESASLRDALAEHEHEEVDQAAISVAKARAAELQESLRTYVRKITDPVSSSFSDLQSHFASLLLSSAQFPCYFVFFSPSS